MAVTDTRDLSNEGVPTSVASTSSATTLLVAAAVFRFGYKFFNNADEAVLLGHFPVATATITASNADTRVPPQTSHSFYGYQGIVQAIWEGSPTGNAQVTEFI